MGKKGTIFLILGACLLIIAGTVAFFGYERYQQYRSRTLIAELMQQFTELKLNFAEHVIAERSLPDPALVEQWIEETTDLRGVSYDERGFIMIDLATATEQAVDHGTMLLVPQSRDGFDVNFVCAARGIDPASVPFSCR